MSEFAQLSSYAHFEEYVKTRARFVPDEAVRQFLQAVAETIEPTRVRVLRTDRPSFGLNEDAARSLCSPRAMTNRSPSTPCHCLRTEWCQRLNMSATGG